MSFAFEPSVEDNQPLRTPFTPFPASPRVLENDLHELITDFFDWLETDWQLPVSTIETQRLILPPPLALTKEFYTIEDLTCFSGYSHYHVKELLRDHCIFPMRPGKRERVYRRQDVASLIEQLRWKLLIKKLDHWRVHFFPPACETCRTCQKMRRDPLLRQLNCSRNGTLSKLRSVFAHFLREVHRLGSVTAWWGDHHTGPWSVHTRPAWGIVYIYLLDRRLLHPSNDELVQLEPVRNMGLRRLTRLWRNRRPEEYHQFLQAMNAANYEGSEMEIRVLPILILFVLLKYGLSGIAELGHPLSSEEIQQVCCEHRLITAHLASGFYLPYPLTADIRVGHVILDDIRHYFWQYAARQEQQQRKNRWDGGPSSWIQMHIGIIEQTLAAPMYEQAKGILSRRPETEGMLISPWHISHNVMLADTGYALLPTVVQEHIMTYITYCHQEKDLALETLRGSVKELIHFFTWVRKQGKLANYPHWTHKYSQEIFRAFASLASAELKSSSRHTQFRIIATFFLTLADLEYTVPPGYHLLYNLEKRDYGQLKELPDEEVMDRIFRDGVCNLTYDVFSRLALAIQYYCGTRRSETLDLHLFCVLEDQRGHAFLLIPKGKTKQERPFPIVEPGMEFLFQYMEEVIILRFTEDGTTSRTLGKTNIRYQNDDPERAQDWHYLFDRVPSPDGLTKVRGCLSCGRLAVALKEAMLIAAKITPEGLFQQSTYNPSCHHHRRKGQKCFYFAAQEGITICPRCSSPLSGRRGVRCYHILEEDFKCDCVVRNGEAFCPKCDRPLAAFLPIGTHMFRHNSVSRADRAGVSLAHNMIPIRVLRDHSKMGEVGQRTETLCVGFQLVETITHPVNHRIK